MPPQPPRRTPSRGSTRPGVRRGQRVTLSSEVQDLGTPEAHAEARSRVISSFALGMTHRFVIIIGVVAVLMLSFVSSFGVYLGQQRDIAQAKADITTHKSEIIRIQDELRRWRDPAYVQAQARDCLGWVLPGEVGYRVVDENGDLIGGTVAGIEETSDSRMIWYDVVWGSLQAADQPAPNPASGSNSPSTFGPDDVEPPR